MREALSMVERLKLAGVTHPKLQKLRHVIKDLVRKNPTAKLIVFANYRSTVDVINRFLGEDGISCEILIGQALKEGRGLSQDEQIKILRRFNEGQFNALIASSIGEEGLSISDVDAVIFYDSVASEIRKIQRRGRTGRTAPGKIIFLITKGTRDEAYYWAAFHREKRMKGILYRMRKKGRKREKTLLEWLKGG
jgi:Fanconi anemia group M protein